MEYHLIATVFITNKIEAQSEEQAREIFRQQLGLRITEPFMIQVVGEGLPPAAEQREELEAENSD